MCAARPLGRRRQPGHRPRRARPVRGGRRADGPRRRSPRLRDDPGTEVILLVSKPPAPEVAARGARGGRHHADGRRADRPGRRATPAPRVSCSPTRSSPACWPRCALLGVERAGHAPRRSARRCEQVRRRLAPGRPLVRGLFSGGTPLLRVAGDPRPDARRGLLQHPDQHGWGLPARRVAPVPRPRRGGVHPRSPASDDRPGGADRAAARACAPTPQVAAVILDVVLGYGAHPDPAAVLAPVCASVMADGGPQVVAYVLGTEQDPQGYTAQRDRLVDAGCIVTETAARASPGRRRHRDRRRRAWSVRPVSSASRSVGRPGRAGHLLDQAPRRRRAHAVARRGAGAQQGMPVRVVALGDPEQRASSGRSQAPVHAHPRTAAGRHPGGTRLRLDRRPRRRASAESPHEVDIFHTQDCISARAAARVRDAGAPVRSCAPSTTSTTSRRRR